tara:strand:+ start:230 stop:829 length:600 start_codon:yes stop_codon:yes gene_type:complete
MIIGILPSVRQPYKNQIELTYDVKLINFLEKLNKKVEIRLINSNSKIDKKFKLIVIGGGNDILKFSNKKEDKYKNKIVENFFIKAKFLKIPILGICYGAQFVAGKFNSKFIKKRKVGQHKINILENKLLKIRKKKIKTNSFKNYLITKISNKLELLARAADGTIEAFFIGKIRFLGIMWHPERFKKFKKFDLDLIKKIL